MGTLSHSLGLSDSAFHVLEQLIRERIGIHFSETRRDLMADKLSGLVVEYGFRSFLDFYYLLKYDATDADWNRVIDALAVQETYFWREYDQVDALVNHVLPRYYQQKPLHPLTIWSAACASGEEPLTIAISLQEAGWLEKMPIQVIGSDASPKALDKAKTGRYRDYALRNLPERIRGKYFAPENGHWRIDPAIHSRVSFRQANLVNPGTLGMLPEAQIVFCRNVFIYFNDETILNVVNSLVKNRAGMKHLFLGAAESLLRLNTTFSLEKVGNSYVYTHRAD